MQMQGKSELESHPLLTVFNCSHIRLSVTCRKNLVQLIHIVYCHLRHQVTRQLIWGDPECGVTWNVRQLGTQHFLHLLLLEQICQTSFVRQQLLERKQRQKVSITFFLLNTHYPIRYILLTLSHTYLINHVTNYDITITKNAVKIQLVKYHFFQTSGLNWCEI